METKICSNCGKELPVSAFNRHGRAKDGLQIYCRACHSRKTVAARCNSGGGLNKVAKVDPTNPLSGFTPRELMVELRRRGYEGELSFISRIDICNL